MQRIRIGGVRRSYDFPEVSVADCSSRHDSEIKDLNDVRSLQEGDVRSRCCPIEGFRTIYNVYHRNLRTCSIHIEIFKFAHSVYQCYHRTALCASFCTFATSDRKKRKFVHKRIIGGHVSIPRNYGRGFAEEENDVVYVDFSSSENSPASYAAMLRSCARQGSGILGMFLHHYIIKNGCDGILLLQNLLVQMYNECGHLYDACRIFYAISFRDHFVWNFMMRACSQNEGVARTTEMYDKMLGEGVLPNKFCYTSLLLAYSSHKDFLEGRRVLARLVVSRIESDALLENAQLTMCCKCADLDVGKQLFDRLCELDVVAWSAMIAAHGKQGKGDGAMYYFKQMLQNGVLPNTHTFISIIDACTDGKLISEGQWLHACCIGSDLERDLALCTALLNMYGKNGDVSRARYVFDGMSDRNTVTWNGMMTAYSLQSQGKDAQALFHQMLQQGVMPDKFILDMPNMDKVRKH
ncbi:hypothetical protein KP509_19G011200 [Ceratopteris richardii]|uniref:Pentatricopeptide repeat-containing protein n=1 Tax=Ceratopteris richardii TaxID=49495 RepID=A0A8T2SJQ7_CERRI|nr:hypothetical protein KP509_19G011200 [Ceratopteris richardii]